MERPLPQWAEQFTPGTACTLNPSGDLMMDSEARHFINKVCLVVKVTKAGKIMVALRHDQKRAYSANKRNVDLLTTEAA